MHLRTTGTRVARLARIQNWINCKCVLHFLYGNKIIDAWKQDFTSGSLWKIKLHDYTMFNFPIYALSNYLVAKISLNCRSCNENMLQSDFPSTMQCYVVQLFRNLNFIRDQHVAVKLSNGIYPHGIFEPL